MRALLSPPGLLLLLALLAFVGAQTPTPSFLLFNPTLLVITRQYATCTQDVHAVARNSTSVGMFVIGGFNTAAVYYNTLDYSTTGYFSPSQAQLQVTSNFTFTYPGYYVGHSPIARIGAVAAVLGNGNVIFGTGKTAGYNDRSNDVLVSSDLGNTWSVANYGAPFAQRSDAVVAAAPGTNIVVIAAGATGPPSNAAGVPANDIWMRSHHTQHVHPQPHPPACTATLARHSHP